MFRFCVALMAVGAWFWVEPALAAAPPVEAYGKLPGIEQISLSPSGQRYAFIAVIGETRKLVAAQVDGTKVLYATNVGDAKVTGVDWAGEDHLLVTVSHTVPLGMDFDVDKAEFSTAIAINLETRKSLVVFDKHPNVANVAEGYYGSAKIKDHWYGFFGGITYGTTVAGAYLEHMWPDLYRVDLDDGQIGIAARGNEDIDAWLVGPDGEVIARSLYEEKNGAWRVLSGGFGGQVLASGQAKLASVGGLERGRTADTILIDRPVDQGSNSRSCR